MLCGATLARHHLLEAIDGLWAFSGVSLLLFLATGAVQEVRNVSAPTRGQLQSLLFTSYIFVDKSITRCRAYLAMSQPPADSLLAYFCRVTRL
jgi:hypothetical protein